MIPLARLQEPAIIALLVSLDQFTKLWARVTLSILEQPLRLTDWIWLEHMTNEGISWGLLHGHDIIKPWMLLALAAVICTSFVSYVGYRIRKGLPIHAYLLVIAGGLSNIIDRLLYGHVTDFITLTWNGWSLPTCNIADLYIVVGIACLCLAYREP